MSDALANQCESVVVGSGSEVRRNDQRPEALEDGDQHGSHQQECIASSEKDEHARSKNRRRTQGTAEERKPAKKQRTKEPPAAHVPTLKDLKDRMKKRGKGAGAREESVIQRSAPLMEWPYDTQLTMKATYVKSAVRSFTKQVRSRAEDRDEQIPAWATPEWSLASRAPVGCGCPLDDPIGTPAEHLSGYRNKCEFTIGLTESGSREVGFVLRVLGDGGQLVAGCQDVPHVPAPMKRLCTEVRRIVEASPFPVYDRRRNLQSGVWRLLMARLSTAGEMLVLIQTATLGDADRQRFEESLVSSLVSTNLGVVSIYLQFNDEVTDAARPESPLWHVHGRTHLRMPLLGLSFEIGPLSFFQANSATCAALYETALAWLRPEGAVVLDVCCGVGTIGLCAAGRCRRVIGIELVAEAVEAARRNAALNGVENASFRVGKAEDVLPGLLAELAAAPGWAPGELCAVVDPPRPGLHPQVLAALRGCAPLGRVVYISCNPESLAEDVVRLTAPRETEPDPFVPVRAVAVDMFPHTLHCEMVLLLERASRVADPRPAAGGAAAPAAPAAPADAALADAS